MATVHNSSVGTSTTVYFLLIEKKLFFFPQNIYSPDVFFNDL